MSIRDDIYTKLSGTAAITALVALRIYPNILAPKAVMPAISFRQISDIQVHVMGTDSGPYRPRYQIDIWGKTYEDVENIADQVKLALRDFTGTMGDSTVQRIFFEDEIDLYEQTSERQHIAQDYIIWYE